LEARIVAVTARPRETTLQALAVEWRETHSRSGSYEEMSIHISSPRQSLAQGPMSHLRRSLAFAASVSLAACAAESPSAPVARPLPALPSAIWHVNISDGQPLPALLGHRLVEGNVLEQDFLDSAQFVVDAGGTWEQRGWYQRFRDGHFHQSATTLDQGTWEATMQAYEFRRASGELVYTIPAPSATQWRIDLRYAGQAGVAVSELRPSRPAPGVVGRWRAVLMNDQALPATYTSDPEIDAGAGIVSRHIIIDSAFVVLFANNSYRQLVFFSEWEGEANGAPRVPVYAEVATDFGSWSRAGDALTLESGWLQNKRIEGDASLGTALPLRLHHGITHGDPPVPLRYARF
jgi:hypothetical protein